MLSSSKNKKRRLTAATYKPAQFVDRPSDGLEKIDSLQLAYAIVLNIRAARSRLRQR
jgi:hypothetical protein